MFCIYPQPEGINVVLYDCTSASWTYLDLETTQMCYCEERALYTGIKCRLGMNSSYNPGSEEQLLDNNGRETNVETLFLNPK